MFLNNLYTVEGITRNEAEIRATVLLNSNSPVYGAHFPGNPITPGACLVEMGRELCALVLEKNMFLEKADHVKFLKGIHPEETPRIEYLILPEYLEEQGIWKIRIEVTGGNVQMTKMVLWLKEIVSV